MKTAFMHPWGTIGDNRIELESVCKLGHDWNISDVKSKKVAVGNGDVQRFRIVTRTCNKCGYSEKTTIRKK
jgi:predicted nucleic-acid-binding Zn-ribbon protein